MNLQIYTIEQNEQWDRIVRSFSEYDTYWLSGYVKAFMIHGDGEPLLFFYDGNDVRGINVVMKRDIAEDVHFSGKIPRGKFYDFSSPYGYGGWLIEGEEKGVLFKTYEEWCINNGIISEFVRFHPVIENHVYSEACYEVVPLGNTITMDLSSPEIIWANITSKNRNMIRKAKKMASEYLQAVILKCFKFFVKYITVLWTKMMQKNIIISEQNSMKVY